VVFFVVDWVFSSIVFVLVDFLRVFSPSVVINHSALDYAEAFFLGEVFLHRSLRFRFRLSVRVTFVVFFRLSFRVPTLLGLIQSLMELGMFPLPSVKPSSGSAWVVTHARNSIWLPVPYFSNATSKLG
jgi:hypothetical protein